MVPGDEDEDGDETGDPEVVEVEIEDSLDLHTFAPRDVKALVEDYLTLAAEKGFAQVRIIHGKGQGTLRRIVEGVLSRHPAVVRFRAGGAGEGGWGATLAELRAPPTS